jgi:hypothetical protein
MSFSTCSLTTAALLGALLVPSVAFAQATDKPTCASLNPTNAIYGAGGSAITATIQRVAAALRAEDIWIFYADPSACEGYGYFLDGSVPNDATLQKKYKYWEANGTLGECYAPEAEPQFAHMGNPTEECAGLEELPENIGDFGGPIQTVNVIADAQSEYNSISAEALYRIFKFGAATADVAPWTTTAQVFRRGTTSFVHQFISKAVGLDPAVAATFGTPATNNNNQGSVNDVAAAGASTPNSPIAYCSGSAADLNSTPDKIKTLAFQGIGQECAYWPDSSIAARDKINVRKGLYALWTPGHFYAEKDENGDIKDPAVRELVGWITGKLDSPPELDVTRKVIEAGDVPECAMQATRSGLIGPIASFAPDKPCGCYFEAIATTDVPIECEACSDDAECEALDIGRPACNYGFCELYRRD